ncbi:LpqB family beta-propeller domain-containing protein [Pseudonocardia spirodelae]|uniref:LpqB family beta-propeller domain-containing protein n=1 Tax=Pseudonocardia spirodelae TaxID=3133431 RepID=A0ABU8TBZ8_9PSEU
MSARRLAGALLVLLCAAVLAGCATVPQQSDVQVLRQGEQEARAGLTGPIEDGDPLGLVRGFVYRSGAPDDRHAQARRYLTASASDWDDGASLTVLSERFDTIVSPENATAGPGRMVVRVRGTRLGTVTPGGAFEASPQRVEIDVGVVREGERWRIDRPPPGVLVRLSDFVVHYRQMQAWFVDPTRGTLLPDTHYVRSGRPDELALDAVDVLRRGPSAGLAGAALTMFPATARIRSTTTDPAAGTATVDLTGVSGLSTADRDTLAAQVAQTLGGVGIPRVELRADGEALLPGRPTVAAADYDARVAGTARPPAFPYVVDGGRVRQLTGNGASAPVAGQAGNGSFDVTAAAASAVGNRIAVVSREATGTQRLLTGPLGGELTATPVSGAEVTALSWSGAGDEIWAVADGRLRRVLVPADAPPVEAPLDLGPLAPLGRVGDLALAREGGRIAVVVDGALLVGPIVPVEGRAGEVAVGPLRRLRPGELDDVVSVDWRSADRLAVASDSDRPMADVGVDGLQLGQLPSANLTAPLRQVAAAPGRPLYVTDRTGLWSYSGGELDAWQQAGGGSTAASPFYPG